MVCGARVSHFGSELKPGRLKWLARCTASIIPVQNTSVRSGSSSTRRLSLVGAINASCQGERNAILIDSLIPGAPFFFFFFEVKICPG